MTTNSTSVSMSTVKLNHTYDVDNYRHLDVTITNLRGLTSVRSIRFKLYNASGNVGLEFRQMVGWPKIFDPWPGTASDNWGELYKVDSEANLSTLNTDSRLKLTDIILAIAQIAEKATSGLEGRSKYLADAALLSQEFIPFTDRQVSSSAAGDRSLSLEGAGEVPEPIRFYEQVSGMEQRFAQFREEFDNYTAELSASIDGLTARVEELTTFRNQIPQMLNVVSAAHAASRTVGEVRALLDSEAGIVTKSLTEFRRELSNLWKAFETLKTTNASYLEQARPQAAENEQAAI